MIVPREHLMLLPGLLCDEAVWEKQIEGLSDVTDCSVPDYGTLHSLGAMAELVLRDAPAEFALAGHSMGGRVALEVYRRAPERVLRLALLDTGCAPREPGPMGESEERGRQALLEIARTSGMREMSRQWLPLMLPPERMADTALVEEILQMQARKTPAIQESQNRALLERPDARDVVRQVRCPALLLTGEEDRWSPPERHEEMAAMIPGSTLILVPGCGHMSTMEKPAEVTRAMRSWLQR